MIDLFSSGIQGFGLAPHRAVQERRSDCSWFSEGHCLFRHVDSHGRPGAHQQDGADHPGRLTFPPWTIKSGFPPVYRFLRLRNVSGSSRDSLRHGFSSPWWERHKEGKTVHPLRTGSSARRPERGRGQSLHSSKRGKLLLYCSQKQELIVKMWWFTSTGHYRHGTDHLWHSHQGARTARDDGSSGRSSPPAAAGGGQAAHRGHRGHL